MLAEDTFFAADAYIAFTLCLAMRGGLLLLPNKVM